MIQLPSWKVALLLPCLFAPPGLWAGLEPIGMVRFPLARGFLDERPHNLTLVGTGVRTREGIPFYSVGYYVNLVELRAAAGPGPSDLDELARILTEGKVAQGIITRFHQPVSQSRRVEFLVVNLRRWWPEPGFDERLPAVRRFVSFFNESLSRGEETQVWFKAGVAYTRKPGRKVHQLPDRSICRAFLGSYLSGQVMEGAAKPLQKDLLRDLLELMQKQTAPTR
jgi:hypothetical protein